MSNIVDQYRITKEPYYRPVADEVELLKPPIRCACR